MLAKTFNLNNLVFEPVFSSLSASSSIILLITELAAKDLGPPVQNFDLEERSVNSALIIA